MKQEEKNPFTQLTSGLQSLNIVETKSKNTGQKFETYAQFDEILKHKILIQILMLSLQPQLELAINIIIGPYHSNIIMPDKYQKRTHIPMPTCTIE